MLERDGTVRVGPIRQDGTGFLPDKTTNRSMRFGKQVGFRLLLEHSLLQFYLDDILMESYSLPAIASGRVGLLGEATVRCAWNARRLEQG